MGTTIEIPNSKMHRDSLMTILFQYGYVYDKQNHMRAYNNVRDLNADVGFCWYIIQIGYAADSKNMGFVHTNPSGLYWPKDADKIIDIIVGSNKSITVPNVGDYTATVDAEGIKVGCQTISFEKFDELTKAVNKIRSLD